MSLETKRDEYIENLVTKLTLGDNKTIEQLSDWLLFGLYGQSVFSQFGMGFDGAVFRQSRTSVLLTIKAVESGVPLVAFVTAGTAMGCVEQMFDLLWKGSLKWQKDKYPWT